MNYPIPRSSQAAFRQHQQQTPQNAGLIFDRFSPDLSQGQDKEAKKKALALVVNMAQKGSQELLTAWVNRWRLTVQAVHAEPFTLKTDWRFVAGLGRKGPLEVGFTFHRYGFPIIPGSSLKGLARAWAFFQIAERLGVPAQLWGDLEACLQAEDTPTQPAQQQALEKLVAAEILPNDAPVRTNGLNAAGDWPKQWRGIFGTQDRTGAAVFFEAIPTSLPELELDIMNPHYSDYYGDTSKTIAPTNWQSPVPVYFLTVVPQTEFCFAVGWRGSPAGIALRKVAEEWLYSGLIELGAGAKTSAGYGYFRPGQEGDGHKDEVTTVPNPEVSPPIEPPPPAKPVSTRSGVITEIRPDKRFGRVRDEETGQEYNFSTAVIDGNTPARKARVVFEVQENRVIKVRKL